MKAFLDEVAVGVKLPEGVRFFIITVSQSSKFVAEPEMPDKLPARLTDYSKISLRAPDILAANDELRTLLKPLGTLHPSYFWFNLQVSKDEHCSMSIEDSDPSRHRTISISGDWPRDNARKLAFSEAVAESKFTERKPYWKDEELYVRLRPAFVHATRRIATYAALLELL